MTTLEGAMFIIADETMCYLATIYFRLGLSADADIKFIILGIFISSLTWCYESRCNKNV